MTVQAATAWATNAHMIEALAELGYLNEAWPTVDLTYGSGNWWKRFRPAVLVGHDLKVDGVDFRHLPEPDGTFRVVAFDGPYKLNGTPTADVDARYGVDVVNTRAGRTELLLAGIAEGARVLEVEGYMLVKCQDQVNGGKVRWQSRDFADHGEACGLSLVDQALLLGGRAQPAGRTRRCPDCAGTGFLQADTAELPLGARCPSCEEGRIPTVQEHLARNYSTLLVFTKPRPRRRRSGS